MKLKMKNTLDKYASEPQTLKLSSLNDTTLILLLSVFTLILLAQLSIIPNQLKSNAIIMDQNTHHQEKLAMQK